MFIQVLCARQHLLGQKWARCCGGWHEEGRASNLPFCPEVSDQAMSWHSWQVTMGAGLGEAGQFPAQACHYFESYLDGPQWVLTVHIKLGWLPLEDSVPFLVPLFRSHTGFIAEYTLTQRCLHTWFFKEKLNSEWWREQDSNLNVIHVHIQGQT